MEKKELIRKSAIKVIARNGYHKAKIQTIADEAGIANGTVYLYFNSKQEILEYIYFVELDKRLKYLNTLKKSTGTVMEKMESLMKYLFDEWESDLDVLKILLQDSMYKERYGSTIREMFDELMDGIAELMEKGYESGEFRQVDAGLFAFIIFNSFRAATYEFKYNKDTDSYEEKKNSIISIFLEGIRKR